MTRPRNVLLGIAVAALAATAVSVIVQRPYDREYRADPEAYGRTDDPALLVVLIVVGVGDEIVGSDVTESANAVRVSVRVRQPGEFTRRPIGVPVPFPVRLESPLADRRVLDRDGREVPERTLVPSRPGQS